MELTKTAWFVRTRDVQKLLKVMRLTSFLLLFSLMQVSAKSYSQKFNLSLKDAALQDVFKTVQQQSDYQFFYNERLLKNTKKVTINVRNASIQMVLEACFKDQPIVYEIDDKQIIIKQKSVVQPELEASAVSPPIDVQGKVVNEKGEPVLATVHLKGTDKRVTTNENGDFKITGVDETGVLVISGVNIETREIKINGQTNLATILVKLKQTDMQEVTVELNTGYQKISSERATGSYSSVGKNLLEKRPVSNISTAINGLAAGVQGQENTDGSYRFLIRGTSSLYAQTDPLIVVDGFPVIGTNFSNINPNDVESITVLKDAAAASIWGARAANGVIVITTKQGKSAKNKVTLEANVFTRISKMIDLDQVMSQANSADQIRYEKMAMDMKWIFPPTPYTGAFADLNKPLSLAGELYYAQQFGKISKDQYNASLDSLSKINNRGQIEDLLMQKAVLDQYNVNLSSTSEKSRTYASLLYEKRKEGFINRGYNRYAVNLNNQFEVTRFLSLRLGANLQYKDIDMSGADIGEIQGLSPYETLLNPNGSYSVNIGSVNREQVSFLPLSKLPYPDWNYNLLRDVRGRKVKTKELNARLQASINIRFSKSLNFESKFQYEKNRSDGDNYQSDQTYYVRNLANTMIDYNSGTKVVGNKYVPIGGILISTHGDMESYVFRNQLNYSQTFHSDHSVSAIIGSEISRFQVSSRTDPWLYGYYGDKNQSTVPLYGYGSAVAPLKNIFGLTATLPGSSTALDWQLDKYVSFYGNASYAYKRKYVLTGSVRSDASNYITDNAKLRWSPLWSIGGMWHLAQESFMKNANAIDRLSLRLTYGQNGNTEKSTSTQTLLSVSTSPNTNTGTITATIADNGNPMLRWERTYTTNTGIDFSFFKNKLTGKVDVYNKIGKDITGLVQLPAATGTTSQKFNNAQISNRGIEIELGGNFKFGKHFVYSPLVTYAYNKNKIQNLYYPNLTASYLINSGSQNFVQGKPVGNIYSFSYLGMKDSVPYVLGSKGQEVPFSSTAPFSQQGMEFLNYEGTTIPPHTLGFANSFSFYNFNLFVLFTGKFGGVFRRPAFDYPTGIATAKPFVNRNVADVFAGDPNQPSFPKYQDINFYNWSRYTPYLHGLVESASYIECKEILLQYSLPAKWLAPVSINNLKIYAQIRDIGLIWQNNSKGYHPEWLPGTSRPMTSYTFGANIQL
ncbi:SusC/RagA family TonB-linked outer membrane protein [Pinibacter aurantiacus]|uniref:SusC/RagA family TonB-linked outer membrane protein n=1 Tax=Pinibacter aurantiacus TaxID=2851599 RepID=A0A9E2SEU9_9BACT|nr:SusC/RagA family TonB-linked outer membrane protein [Pinibacter aurantiacus]MBV4358840.1 SusC/RagA family TonB-linked outer membrane protein [Pinibacter aurantiacus]